MCAQTHSEKPALLSSLLTHKCPRCRRGKLYKHQSAYQLKGFMQMNAHCPVCGQSIDMEVGFYYGTGYVSYALAIAVTVASFLAWWVIIGLSLADNRFFWWMGFNALLLVALQPPLMRLSRTIWLWFFVRYSPDWHKGDVVAAERTNDGLKNAW
ncbi:DUF983 domain-containing protein [Paraflavisolibacter sp. H34]|uniref:DUF983 domain-containing protein n=1 Tax=Huijunlia imazamoxiresistens TaxID=3127457 RepID=UPI0030186088